MAPPLYRADNFDTRLEWNRRRGLEKTVEALVRLVQLFGSDPPVGR